MTHLFFPYKKICEVPIKDIQNELLKIFGKWGKPQSIKVDNGRPLGDPQLQIVPILSMWLIALGIKVIFNRPRRPQDNAKVERNQGVLSNWTEWHKCADIEQLRTRLQREVEFHNSIFPVAGLKGLTRIQAFPDLIPHSPKFDPKDFDPQRALDFLASGSWERLVAKNGQFSFWHRRITVGTAYALQTLSIVLDPKANQWRIFDAKGELVKAIDTNINAQSLENLILFP